MYKTLFMLTILFLLLSFPLLGKKRGERVISLSPALTEIIFALGAGGQLAGRSSACNHPLQAEKLPVMGDFGNPKRERILRSKAKLVVTNDLINPSLVKRYKSMGIELVMLPLVNEKDYLYTLSFLGRKLRKEKEAAFLRDSFQKTLALLREKRKKIPTSKRKKALFLVWDKPLLASGGSSLPGCVLALAGVQNIAEHVKSEYFKASLEWIIKEDPDFILFPGQPAQKMEHFRKDPNWKNLRAVREGNLIYDLDENMLLRPGPRWGEGILLLQKRIYFP